LNEGDTTPTLKCHELLVAGSCSTWKAKAKTAAPEGEDDDDEDEELCKCIGASTRTVRHLAEPRLRQTSPPSERGTSSPGVRLTRGLRLGFPAARSASRVKVFPHFLSLCRAR